MKSLIIALIAIGASSSAFATIARLNVGAAISPTTDHYGVEVFANTPPQPIDTLVVSFCNMSNTNVERQVTDCFTLPTPNCNSLSVGDCEDSVVREIATCRNSSLNENLRNYRSFPLTDMGQFLTCWKQYSD